MKSISNVKGLLWNIIAGLIAGYTARYYDIKDMPVHETIVLVLYVVLLSLLVFYFVWDKKEPPANLKPTDQAVRNDRIKLSIDNNLPSPKAISISQDLIDRWNIDWEKLSSIISHDCLPVYYHTGLTGDYRPIESIEYEGGYHHDKTQKETILSFYFKESDINRLENILKYITT